MKNKNLNQHTADIDSNCSCVCVCVCVCAYHCLQLCYTIQHRTVLIIFLLSYRKSCCCRPKRTNTYLQMVTWIIRCDSCKPTCTQQRQQAQLLQTDHVACYITWNLVNCCTTVQTRQFNRPMSNSMATLPRENTTPQSLADAHCSSAMQ